MTTMMAAPSATRFVEVIGASDTVRFTGRVDAAGLHLAGDGIEGWYGQPDRKVTLTERQTGDGDFPVRDEDLHFAARTITIHAEVLADTRDDLLASVDRIMRLTDASVQVRVVDAGMDTWAAGYLQAAAPATWSEHSAAVTLTVVCVDPRRYSTAALTRFLTADTGSGGGLVFPIGQPVSFGGDGLVDTTGLLLNAGTAPAFPTFTVHGTFPAGVRISAGSLSVTYVGPIAGAPLTLDSLTRTASVGGLDRSQFLGERDFPVVPAGGSLRVAFMPLDATTGGWCEATVRDTYI